MVKISRDSYDRLLAAVNILEGIQIMGEDLEEASNTNTIDTAAIHQYTTQAIDSIWNLLDYVE